MDCVHNKSICLAAVKKIEINLQVERILEILLSKNYSKLEYKNQQRAKSDCLYASSRTIKRMSEISPPGLMPDLTAP